MIEPVELTKRLVGIKSCNPGEYEGGIGDFIFDRLNTLGLPVRRQQALPGRYNLIAEIKGKTELPPLVILCHMDTVVVGDGWTKAPFAAEEKDGRIYGRGACDMKSGLACALSVLEELWQRGLSPERTIYFMATVDEEAEMSGIQALIRENFIPDDCLLLDLEPTSLAVASSHKGRLWYHVRVGGITAHASTPWKGADAIAAASEFIAKVRGDIYKLPAHPDMGASTVTFGMINGGYQPYVVPDSCVFTMDVRTASPYSSKDIEALMLEAKKEAEAELPGVQITWEKTGDRPCVSGDRASPLCMAIEASFRELYGQEAHTALFPGYTDTAVASAALNNPKLVSFGPGALDMAHKPDEYVETDEIVRCKNILERAINKLCFTKPGS